MAWHRRPQSGECVVQKEPRPQVEPVPGPVLQGQKERGRMNQVRRNLLDEKLSLVQCLSHQPDIQSFEITKPPVDQFARTTRSARGEVALLEEGHGETTAGRIESCLLYTSPS